MPAPMPAAHSPAPAADLAGLYRGRRVLVTGADGFLGLNAASRLAEFGAELSILSRRERPRAAGLAARVFRGDLCDESVVRAAVAGQACVFDFSGVSGAVQSNSEPFAALEAECRPHLNLYHACAALDPSPVVVFCSSRLVYGPPHYLPVDERHPLCPQSIYAVHKLTIENYLRVFARVRGLRHVIFRLTNPYGPRQAPETTTHGIINTFARLAARGEPITLFGEGDQRRDILYVADAIDVFLRAALTPACHNETFNLGGRAGVSLRDAAQALADLAGGTPVAHRAWPREYLSVETGDYQSDLRKLEGVLGPLPHTPLREGLALTLAYYRSGEASLTMPD